MSVDSGPFRLGDVGGTGPAVLCVHGLIGTFCEGVKPSISCPNSRPGRPVDGSG